MKAVILAAGTGSRLRWLTDNCPKCLVCVHGKPVMEYQLEALEEAGVRSCVLVVGYRAGQIRSHFGTEYGGVALSYVENRRFAETNNIYSLWLARDKLDEDILLLEGDLIFDPVMLRNLVRSVDSNVAVVDSYKPDMDGTVILAEDGVVDSMVLKVNQGPDFDYGRALKTVNIYKLSGDALRTQVFPEMARFMDGQRTDQYYEAVFAELVAQGRLRLNVLPSANHKWAEIDSISDLNAGGEAVPS